MIARFWRWGSDPIRHEPHLLVEGEVVRYVPSETVFELPQCPDRGRRNRRRDRPARLRLLPGVGRALRTTRRRTRSSSRASAKGSRGPRPGRCWRSRAASRPATSRFTQAREREEPRPDIPGLAHLWMLFVRPPWWGSGLAAQLNGLAVEEAAAPRLRRDAPAHARRQPPRAGRSTSARAGARTASRSPSRCSASTSWSTAAICEDPSPCSVAGPMTHRRSPTAPRR